MNTDRAKGLVKKALGLLLALGALVGTLPAAYADSSSTYEYLTHMTGNTTWAAPISGWYRVHAYGAGGNGSYGFGSKISTNNYRYAIGAGGGSGGYVVHQIFLQAGQSLQIAVSSSQTQVIGTGVNLLAGAGGNGQNQGDAAEEAGVPRSDWYKWTGTLKGGAGGTASGGNRVNTMGNIGVDGHIRTSGSDLEGYPPNNGAASSGPYGGSGGIGGHPHSGQAGGSKYLSGYTGFGAGGGGGAKPPSLSDGTGSCPGGTGAPGGVVIEALQPAIQEHTTILLENKTSGMAPTVTIQAYTAASGNIWVPDCGLKVNSAVGGNLTMPTIADAPEPGMQSYRWVKPAGAYPLTFETGMAPFSPMSVAAGDYIVVSAWYRSSSALASGNITTQLFAGEEAAPVTLITDRSTFIANREWQRYYVIFQADDNIDNLDIRGPGIGLAYSLDIEFNGIVWQVIPESSGWASGMATKKWAWGKQDASYFATQGIFFAEDSFEVSGQNGWLTVYAKTIDDKEKVEYFYVDNVIVDVVPPTQPIVMVEPVGWTNQAVTVMVSSTDDDTGVAKLQYSEDGARWIDMMVENDTAQYVFPAGNRNQLYYFRAVDGAGNSSEYTMQSIQQDNISPAITGVDIPTGWAGQKEVRVDASDAGSGVKEYSMATSATAPADGWQDSPVFAITQNGTYYAYARDQAGNISAGRYCYVSQIDSTPPEIASITYSTNATTVAIRGSDSGSGVACIYIDDVKYPGGFISADLEEGARYIRIVVEDVAGNKSEEVSERVPGWYDELDTLSILPVEFTNNNQQATITAASTGNTPITGIYVNDKLRAGNPVIFPVPSGTQYLYLQAVDANGDRSILYEVRVPGWSAEVGTLSIASVQFSEDNQQATITAIENGGKGLRGIWVNGVLYEDNPLVYDIPYGVRHLEIQAEDNMGDRSALVKRRVPGWSEVVTTLSITDVTWLDYNKTAQITATATGGDSVAGIYVNDVLMEGNPVIYQVPKDTEILHIQAVNPNGDKSPMVNKQVPIDLSKSTLKLYIENPGWTKSSKAKVKITAEDVNQITKVMVRTAEQQEWTDVTDSRHIYITADTTIFASVQNERGETKEVSRDVVCFDAQAPTVTAAQDRNTINIRAADDKSGVVKILVNNREYTDIEDGKLTWQIPEGTTLVTVKAEDAAGNVSRAVEIPLQTLVAAAPVITPPPASESEPEPEEAKIPDPEPEPTPELAPEPKPDPMPEEPPTQETEESESSPTKLAAAVAGAGTTSLGGIWYWIRRKALSKPEELLEAMKGKIRYDESEFGGPIDPLDKLDPK